MTVSEAWIWLKWVVKWERILHSWSHSFFVLSLSHYYFMHSCICLNEFILSQQNEIESMRLNAIPTCLGIRIRIQSLNKWWWWWWWYWIDYYDEPCALCSVSVFSVLFSLNAHHTFMFACRSCIFFLFSFLSPCGYYCYDHFDFCCFCCCCCQYCFCKRILVDYINSDGQLFGSDGMIGVFDIGAARSLTSSSLLLRSVFVRYDQFQIGSNSKWIYTKKISAKP